jgi:hypothetical protein
LSGVNEWDDRGCGRKLCACSGSEVVESLCTRGPPTHRLIGLAWRMWANMNTRVSFSAARPD